MIPNCPTHGSPMRAGNKGGFFCPKKMPDGSYCTQRSRGAVETPAIPAPQAVSSTTQQTTPRHLLVIASLDFASRVYQGSAQDIGAINLAQAVLREFDAELL